MKEIRTGRFDNTTKDKLNKVLASKGPFIGVKIARPDTLLIYDDAVELRDTILLD